MLVALCWGDAHEKVRECRPDDYPGRWMEEKVLAEGGCMARSTTRLGLGPWGGVDSEQEERLNRPNGVEVELGLSTESHTDSLDTGPERGVMQW